jgi:hypothetical protein
VWQLAKNPIYLDANHCLKLVPERFIQASPTQTSGGYQMSVGAELTLELSTQCKDPSEERALAPLAVLTQLPKTSQLQLTQLMDNSALSSQLTRAYRGRFGHGEAIESIAVRTTRLGAEDVLLLGVELKGRSCGTAWLSAELAPASEASLKLGQVRFLNPASARALPALEAYLLHASKPALLQPTLAFRAAAKRLGELLQALAVFPGDRVHVSTSQGPARVTGALVDEAGVLAVAEMELTLGVRLQQAPKSTP